MNNLCSVATIVAGLFGIMMTFVSWRVLKGNPILDNPVIHVAVGVLTFIGLRYRLGGLIGQILLGYKAVAISILFLLLWRAFQKTSKAHAERKKKNQIAKQSSQLREGPQDLQKPKTQSSRSAIQKRID